MYERFSDRARKIMQLANQEAQRFNHEYIGTEHMLIAVCREETCTGALLIKHLGGDSVSIRARVHALVQAGPDMVTMGKLPQTPRAKKVIENAMVFAQRLNHNYVGTEHIVLGFFADSDSVACHVLGELGIEEETAYRGLVNLLANEDVGEGEVGEGVAQAVTREELSDAQVKLKLLKTQIIDLAYKVEAILETLKDE